MKLTSLNKRTKNSQEMHSSGIVPIVKAQLTSLSDTDSFATSWEAALEHAASNQETFVKWGGRGRGGRGLARRTFQPHDVIVEGVRLEYVGDHAEHLPSKLLLEGGTLKLLAGHVYGLVGRNGSGKSSLLRRIHSRMIPGFPSHITSVFIPQEGIPYHMDKTPLEMALSYYNTFRQESNVVLKNRSEELARELELLDMTSEEEAQRVNDLCNEIAALEETIDEDSNSHDRIKVVTEALQFFGIDAGSHNLLSPGQKTKVALACALCCPCDLLLLDESNYLDFHGLVQLRRLISICEKRKTTVLLTSHDVDLINDVVTDIIHFSNCTLSYYAGNYDNFVCYKDQQDLHQMRQQNAMEKKHDAMLATLDNIKKQPVPKRGGTKKKAKAVENCKKKIERLGLELDKVKVGTDCSLPAIDVSSLKASSRMKREKMATGQVDKAVQFVFRGTTCSWGEPLITAMDISHCHGLNRSPGTDECLTKLSSMILECLDLCVDEGKRILILGSSASGKTTLLRLLAKLEQPLEGRIQYAQNISVGFLDQYAAEELMEYAKNDPSLTALSLLAMRYPQKSEQDIRGELTSFGLSPKQVSTSVRFLSGGERSRLCFASLMLADPDVLLLDMPTSHLDAESVEALVRGLNNWNGTFVVTSHDVFMIRNIENVECFVIMEKRLFRLRDGLGRYMQTLQVL